jgi:hypothetical protein
VKIHHIVKQLFPALVIFGLLLGCGGDKDTEKPAGDDQNGGSSSGTQGGGDKKVTLAKFLPGKRLYVEVDMSQMGGGTSEEPDEGVEEDPSSIGPGEEKGETPISTAAPGFRKMEMALQFEKDGKFFPARKMAGKWVSLEDDLTYKVTGPLKVTVYEDGKGDGGVTFPTAQPKKGDKIKFGPDRRQAGATITKIEDASPLATRPQDGGGDPDETAPEPGDPSEEGLPEAEPVEEKKK